MIILLLGLLGLCLGSFANALVWRWRQQRVGEEKRPKKVPKELTITQGRSMCPSCRHQLGFWDLLPVVSWLALRGKCRYCHKPISWQYPVVEALTAGLFIVSYLYWPLGWSNLGIFQFAIWLIVLVGLLALLVYDARWQLLPSRLVYPLGALVALQVVVVGVVQGSMSAVLGAASGAICLGGLFYLIFAISDGKWIGGGDVRLGFVLGALVGGLLEAVMVLFFASVLGTLFSLPTLSSKNNALKLKVAFGPFLIAAAIIVYLFGASFIGWYEQHLLLL